MTQDVRKMHCPACNEQISPVKALLGLSKRPFHCSRCNEVIEIAPGLSRLLWFPAFLAFWRVKIEYGNTLTTALAFLLIVLILAVLQLLLKPVRRATFD